MNQRFFWLWLFLLLNDWKQKVWSTCWCVIWEPIQSDQKETFWDLRVYCCFLFLSYAWESLKTWTPKFFDVFFNLMKWKKKGLQHNKHRCGWVRIKKSACFLRKASFDLWTKDAPGDSYYVGKKFPVCEKGRHLGYLHGYLLFRKRCVYCVWQERNKKNELSFSWHAFGKCSLKKGFLYQTFCFVWM